MASFLSLYIRTVLKRMSVCLSDYLSVTLVITFLNALRVAVTQTLVFSRQCGQVVPPE